MKTLRYIGEHIRTGCVYFLILQLIITGIYQLSASSQGGEGQFLLFYVELEILLVSLALAFIQDILKIKKWSLTARVLLHFLLYLLIMLMLFSMVMGGIKNVNGLLYVMIFAIAAYLLFGGVALIVYSVIKKKDSGAGYESQFGGKK